MRQKVIDLVNGKGNHLELGYTILCNRNQENIQATLSERNAMEKSFFNTAPWSAISSDRVGIGSLKARLDGLLVNLARQHFQEVANDLYSANIQCNTKLQELGPPRTSSAEQRLHLTRITMAFQDLAARAVDAYYGRDKCFSTNESLRLATRIKTLQDLFSSVLRSRGATRRFKPASKKIQTHNASSNDSVKSLHKAKSATSLSSSEAFSDLEFDQEIAESAEFPENADLDIMKILPRVSFPGQRPQEDVLAWIRVEYERSRGFELGTFHPSFLPALYHEQIKYWRHFTLKHIGEVIQTIHRFVLDLLQQVCAERSVRDQLWAALRDPVFQAYQRPLEHVELLLRIEERGNLRTLNHYFAITLKKKRLERVQKRLRTANSYSASNNVGEPLVRIQDVVDMHTSNDDQIVEDLLDVLQSYYKVARKQFVDAVTKGAVDYLLLVVENGPLSVCSPTFVASLSVEELSRIAGESMSTSQIRERLMTESKILEDGFHVLKS